MYRQSDPHGVPGREVELQDETPHELPTESDASPDGGSPPHRVLSVSPTDLKKACTPAAVFSGELHDRIALLVIDMQETFRSVGAPLLPRIRPLIDLCQSADHCETAMVIFTQHGHEPDATEEEDGELGRFWGRENLIRRGTPPWELMAEIKPNAKRILDKQRYDAFFNTNLHEILSFAGVTTVIICGVLTNLCCETTARSAFVRDFNVWFLSDGTGARTPTMQQATEGNLEYGVAKVMTCEEAMERVRQREKVVLDEANPQHLHHHHHHQHAAQQKALQDTATAALAGSCCAAAQRK